MNSTQYWDALETRSADERASAHASTLADLVRIAAAAEGAAPGLRDTDPGDTLSRDDLAKLPLTRKSELPAAQAANPPFAGLNATPVHNLSHVFASPGNVYEPEADRTDYWRMARAIYAAGIRAGDLVHNTFSYHFTPAGFMLESGARAVGCPVFPAGIGQTELQVQAMAHFRPAAYIGTPSFLNILLEKAAEAGADISSLKRGLVSGEALPPSLRAAIGDRGVSVLQAYATADVGLIAYESDPMEGLIVDEGVVLEIVRPGTGDPVPDGEVGEVVVTPLNPDYPLIRFATGDMSAVLTGESPCGRTNQRIKGWMGRADQTSKIKGMFVHPSQVAQLVARHAEVAKARVVVTSDNNQDVMTVRCELVGAEPGGLRDALATSVRELCKLRGEVELVGSGELPNDGKVIDDQRTYE